MLNIEKILRNSLSKVKVVHSLPGRLRLKIPYLSGVPMEYRKYDKEIYHAVKILNGIQDLSINYIVGTVLITYDTDVLYEKKVICWIRKVIQVCLNNTKLFKQYFESNFQYVIKTIEQQLKDSVKEL